MLHEILLSLSGVPSPLLESADAEVKSREHQDGFPSPYTSAPEREMLKTLAQLADIRLKVKDKSITISRAHPSPVCRAVSTSIRTVHLQVFADKVLSVESSILRNDAAYVGAYRSVPLSTLLTEFQPWLRPLNWLMQTLQSLSPECSTSKMFLYLHRECQTGYTDLRDIATALLVTAQRAWINFLMPWLLFGELPHMGRASFMIKTKTGRKDGEYFGDPDQTPYFVSNATAESVLAIGKALRQIRSRTWVQSGSSSAANNISSHLLPYSLEKVKSLSFPIKTSDFDNVIEAVDTDLSETALSQFLPADAVLGLLIIASQFLLMRNSEFAIALVDRTTQYLRSQSSSTSTKPVRKLSRLNDFKISEPELSSILAKVWSDLPSNTFHDQLESSLPQKAVAWIHLTSVKTINPVNTLLPTPASLVLQLPSDSALSIFMSVSDNNKYADISAYLLSIQRAKTLIVGLWNIPELRRRTPSSLLIRKRNTDKKSRAREEHRACLLRPYWACASQIILLMTEMAAYLQGEVIENSWGELRAWLQNTPETRPSSARFSSRPTTASSQGTTAAHEFPTSKRHTQSIGRRTDPRVLSHAHRRYLDTLCRSLLLDNKDYTSILSDLLSAVTHFAALFHQLQTVWQGIDLQQDSKAMTAFSDYQKEESELLNELKRTASNITDGIHDLVGSIRELEKRRDLRELNNTIAEISIHSTAAEFQPWIARSLDRLLMRLDSLAGDEREDAFVDAIVGDAE